MAEVNGQLTTCDRCGAQVFRKVTGEGEADGGYTRWNTFEPYPEGWELVAVPKHINTGNGNAHNNYLQVCPACSALWGRVINESFLRGTEYYHIEQKEG